MTTITFRSEHRPILQDDDYTLTVTQAINADGTAFSQTTTHNFRVAGPQFQLLPDAVATVYPPSDSVGDHAFVLPHVTLTRATLPWERSAASGKHGNPPWLAILLLDDDELNSRDVKVQNIAQKFLDTSLASEDKARVIEADNDYLADRLPKTAADVALLCHVREADHGGETGVVLGARLPHAGAVYHAFLVSVENCYLGGSFSAEYKDPAGKARVVVLKSWRFTNKANTTTLIERLQKLNHDPLTLQSRHQHPTVNTHGASLFPYKMRDGSSLAAFYRSPLAPGEGVAPTSAELAALPQLRNADSLVRYRDDVALFDVTYAAAWELGRLLALATGSFSQTLIRWKHHAKTRAIAAQAQANVAHLSFERADSDPTATIPKPITTFLEKLSTLELIPHNYLLPEPDALPADAIRFFQVDQYWVRCLLEGALSIGRFLSNDHQHEDALRQALALDLSHVPKSGLILRSDIAKAFPSLVIEGHENNGTIHLLDRYQLEPGLLLCTCDVVPQSFVLHPALEEVHCEVKPNATQDSLRVLTITGTDSATFASSRIATVRGVTYQF